jgi:hypothetical protein
MKRGSLLIVPGLALCMFAFAQIGTFSSAFSAPPAPRTPEEKIVSEIAGSILDMAAIAGHYEPSEPFQVRNISASEGESRYVALRRGEQYTLTIGPHPWTPSSYVRLARSLMTDGAEDLVSEDPAADSVSIAPVLARPAATALQLHTARVSRLLMAHPRSAPLHERAALLIGAGLELPDATPTMVSAQLTQMTAHLAVARALHQGLATNDGRRAEQTLARVSAHIPMS